jgi:hypothetical protein
MEVLDLAGLLAQLFVEEDDRDVEKPIKPWPPWPVPDGCSYNYYD